MSVDTGVVSGVSVAHGHATVEQIETACAHDERAAVEALLAEPDVEEAFALQTCNRAEAYVVTDDADRGREILAATVAEVSEDAIMKLDHEASLRHLMRVACGLESLVIGEDQILGQVQDAAVTARAVGGLGDLLEGGVEKAIHVGERARTETAINEGATSLASAASALASAEGDLAGATGLVVGAGEMGAVAASALATSVETLFVANRTPERAEHVAAEVAASGDDANADDIDSPDTDSPDADGTATDVTAIGLADLDRALARADVVLSATASAEPVVEPAALEGAGDTLVIDIAQPRDVPPAAGDIPAIDLRDLDALEAVTDESCERREREAGRVEAMIDREFERLLAQYKRGRADEVIGAMYESAEHIKNRELDEAFAKLEAETEGELTEEERAVIESLADSLVGQLLAAPTRSLRDAAEADDWSTISTALGLFDPEFGDRPEEAAPDDVPAEIPESMRGALPPAVRERLDGD